VATVSIALTEDGFNNILQKFAARSTRKIPSGDWVKLGPLRLRLNGASGHAEVKSNAFSVIDPPLVGPRGHLSELDWVWDQLFVGIGLDIPRVTVGGWCIIPKPFGGCLLRLPKKTFFEDDPDISTSINLGGLRHEVSASFSAKTQRIKDAHALYFNPEMPIDVDVLDISDMVGDLLDRLVDRLVHDVLGFLPEWARDIVSAILGGIARLIRSILDFGDDLAEWISQKIGISLGLFNTVISLIIEFFFKPEPVFELADPYEVLAEEQGLPAVKLAIQGLDAVFNASEQSLTLTVSV
jgi:hypothetical protein